VVNSNGLVSGDHADVAAEQLLRHLVTEKLSLGEAVDKIAAKAEPDAASNSVLRL